MKKIINRTTSVYEVWLRNRPYRVQPQNYLICEDEVAKEFMKYYPTVLRMENTVEIPKPPEVKVETSKIEEPKIEIKPKVAKKVIEKIKEKISPKTPKKVKVKKSKK